MSSHRSYYLAAFCVLSIAGCGGSSDGSDGGPGVPPPAGDSQPPNVSITTPSSTDFETTGSAISLGGTATDNVAVQSVRWANSAGGSGTASGVNDWASGDISLEMGANTLTITAADTSGNESSDTIVVTRTDPGAPDTTAPIVTITSPTTATAITVSNQSLTVTGTAFDNVEIADVTYVLNNGQSAGATGTNDWSTGALQLREGPNTIVVQAADLAGNTGSDQLQVTYDPSAVSNVNLCENVPISDTLQKTIPQMALPAYLSRVTEPTFGTTMIRISDALPDGVIKPMYNTIQAWNADESRLILYHTGTEGNGHHIYDGNTYEHIKRLNITPGDIEQVFWDFNDPDIFYYIHNNRGDVDLFSHLVRYNITDDSRTPIKDFSSVCDEDAGVVGGSDIQMMSWDSNVIGVMCRRENKSWFYDIQNDVNGPVLTIGDGTVFNERPAIMPAPSGEYFYHSGYILDRDMEIAVQLDAASAFEHNSFGRTVDGRDAYFALAFAASPNGCDGGADRGAGHLVLHDVESGACRVIIGRSLGYDTPSISGTHITALSYRNPGWAALSTIDLANIANADNFTSGQPAPLFFSEIYLANTDPANPVTCRLAHHRSYGKAATVGAYNGYFAEPHLGLSPSGTRVLFGSDWYDSGSVNTFVIELPVHQP